MALSGDLTELIQRDQPDTILLNACRPDQKEAARASRLLRILRLSLIRSRTSRWIPRRHR